VQMCQVKRIILNGIVKLRLGAIFDENLLSCSNLYTAVYVFDHGIYVSV